jgi:hypothetical protein
LSASATRRTALVVDRLQVGQVAALALDPWLDRLTVDGVRAALDDLRDVRPERSGDPVQQGPAAAILDRVVKHRRDRLILVATVLDHQTRDDEQVRQVGDSGARTPLTFVDRLRQGDGATEAVGKDGRRALHLPDPDGTRGELSSRNLRDFARPRNHAIRVTPSHPVRREALHMDVALNAFNGVDTAAEAYADARDRSAPTGHWQDQVGLVEHHEDGHLVLRGTFAGNYVDVDEAAHTSEEGAA